MVNCLRLRLRQFRTGLPHFEILVDKDGKGIKTMTKTQMPHVQYAADFQKSTTDPVAILTEDTVRLSRAAKESALAHDWRHSYLPADFIVDAEHAYESLALAHEDTTIQNLEQAVRDAAAGNLNALSRLEIIR
jgi:hypothetical protein